MKHYKSVIISLILVLAMAVPAFSQPAPLIDNSSAATANVSAAATAVTGNQTASQGQDQGQEQKQEPEQEPGQQEQLPVRPVQTEQVRA